MSSRFTPVLFIAFISSPLLHCVGAPVDAESQQQAQTSSQTPVLPTEIVDQNIADETDSRTVVDVAFGAELSDVGWSESASQDLLSLFDSPGFLGTTALSVECRETICLVITGHEDYEAYSEFNGTFGGLVPWDTTIMFYFDSSAPLQGATYVSRLGYSLPGPGDGGSSTPQYEA